MSDVLEKYTRELAEGRDRETGLIQELAQLQSNQREEDNQQHLLQVGGIVLLFT